MLFPEMHVSDLGTNHLFEDFCTQKWEHPKQISGGFLLYLSFFFKPSMHIGFSNQSGFLLKIWIPWPRLKPLK